jgi:hypothetical protein
MKGRKMSNCINEVLLRNKAVLSETIIARLKTSGAVHYQAMDRNILQSRIDNLVDTFLKAMNKRPGVFVTYLKQIAEDRISEGVFLHEIQVVMQILEEKSWRLVVENIPQSDQVRCLSQITGTIGAAKDQLAHIYLQHLEKAEKDAAFLKWRLDEMVKGTDSGPVVDEVLPPTSR